MPKCYTCGNLVALENFYEHGLVNHGFTKYSPIFCGELECYKKFSNYKLFRLHWSHMHKVETTFVSTQNIGKKCSYQSNPTNPVSVNREIVQNDLNITKNKNKSSNQNNTTKPMLVGNESMQNVNNSSLLTNVIQSSNSVRRDSIEINFQSDLNLNKDNLKRKFVDCDTINVKKLKNLIHEKAIQKVSYLYADSTLARNKIQLFIDMHKEIVNENYPVYGYILQRLKDLGESDENYNSIIEALKVTQDVFHGLNTEYLRLKALKEIGILLPPIQHEIGSRYEPGTTKDGQVIEKHIDIYGEFISIKDTLKKVFEMKGVLKKVTDYMKNLNEDKEVLSNFIQGSLWKDLTKDYNASDIVIPIFLFFDDYETGNALGSHSGVYKVGATYFSIPVFPPQFQSSLKNIFLAELFYTDDRKTCGNASVFSKLIDELQFLQDKGLLLNTSEGEKRVYFKLALITGDNLGLNSVFGLVECFVANFYCRFCKLGKEERKYYCREDPSTLRTVVSYQKDLLLNDVSQTGLKEDSAFHKIKGFHILRNIVVDIMHDLFEGVCDEDMAEILINFIFKKKYFTLQELNDRIRYYDYGPIDKKNMPPPLSDKFSSKNKTISMTAKEMWTFVLHFGLMMGACVPPSDPVWLFYLNLRDIICLVTSSSLQKDCSYLLDALVEEHNRSFVELFSKSLKPKAHFLTHYGRVLRTCGTLVKFWSMRYEAKHQDSKITGHLLFCKKNVIYSLALKQQLKFSNFLLDNKGLTEEVEIGPVKSISTYGLPISIQKDFPTASKSNLLLANWVKISGTEYKKDLAILSGEENGLLIFGLITSVILNKEMELFFLCEKLEIVEFNLHFNAYEVQNTNFEYLTTSDQLLNPIPIHVIKEHGKSFICLRHMP